MFYTHLTYNWATNTITKATSTVGFYLTQFLSTLIPTLLVEGALLWLFGFRSRQDWLVFALVNLATQLGLPAALGSTMMATGGHYFYYLMILPLEAIVLVVEIVAYRILLQEHSTAGGWDMPCAPMRPAMLWVTCLSTWPCPFWPGRPRIILQDAENAV